MGDVARLAGVSHQTVSRVINGADRVAPTTRRRVEDAMRLLDYRPSSVARALVTGRSRTVGVVGFNTTLYGPASTLFGIERAAFDADYLTSVVSMPELDSDSFLLATERLRRHNVEGLLAVAPHRTAISALLSLGVKIPIVCVEAGPDTHVASVAVDQYGGAREATQHLLDLGHRTVAHLAGPEGWQEATIRLAAWRDTLLAAGIAPDDAPSGDWSASSGYDLGRALIRRPGVTAIFVANDQMALGAMHAIHAAGLRIPQDISIVGFDETPESSFFTPALTTVRQDFVEVGRQGFELLRDQIETAARAITRVVLPYEFVLRDSTGPVPA